MKYGCEVLLGQAYFRLRIYTIISGEWLQQQSDEHVRLKSLVCLQRSDHNFTQLPWLSEGKAKNNLPQMDDVCMFQLNAHGGHRFVVHPGSSHRIRVGDQK